MISQRSSSSNQRNSQTNRRNQAREKPDPLDRRPLLVPRHLHVQIRVRVSLHVQRAARAEENAPDGAGDGMLEPSQQRHYGVGIAALEVVLVAALDAVEFVGLVLVFRNRCVLYGIFCALGREGDGDLFVR